jgi:hypothetical protein
MCVLSRCRNCCNHPLRLWHLTCQAHSQGPFIAGERITQVDAALIPKLYHTKVALKELKGWEIPAKLENVHKYLKVRSEDTLRHHMRSLLCNAHDVWHHVMSQSPFFEEFV